MRNSLKDIIRPLPALAVSLLNSDLADLASVVKKLERIGIKILHLDVMDGHFVPNLTFGPPLIKCLRKHTNAFLTAHLMIENPQDYISQYMDLGINLIIFHYESLHKKMINKLINKIKKSQIFCGISVNPETDIKNIFSFLEMIDLVLIMTVNPGFGGQRIIKKCINKIKALKDYKIKNNLDFVISCDGGINEYNINKVLTSGCEIPVVGNAIFGSSDYIKKVKIFKELTNSLKFHRYLKK
ncbi:MAG: ribulose-phosphate 3-epimerase [Elusimicrobiota bacterium]|nr:ribulose-phosphate 3-epimerase [Endomicrobiia bacterium]MDW8166312.1 ribulose-phosphate 3-epimerase [Elusimicrobiota bacterium]